MVTLDITELRHDVHLRFKPEKIITVDSSYACPSVNWIDEDFAKFFMKYLFKRNWWRGWRPRFDCDNYAELYHAYAQVAHAQTGRKGAEGLAVGIFAYIDEELGPHAINIVYTSRSTIRFVEPQRCEFIKLSQQEQQSCLFVYF